MKTENMWKLYALSEEDKARLSNWHYKAPKKSSYQIERYSQITEATKAVAKMMMSYCPKSRQLSIALIKLEEARMWANNAISSEELQ